MYAISFRERWNFILNGDLSLLLQKASHSVAVMILQCIPNRVAEGI